MYIKGSKNGDLTSVNLECEMLISRSYFDGSNIIEINNVDKTDLALNNIVFNDTKLSGNYESFYDSYWDYYYY